MISFTKDEMKALLKRAGFEIKEIDTWDYSWDFEEATSYKMSTKTVIAFKGSFKPSEELLKGQATFIEREFGLKVVFERVLKGLIGELFRHN